jgi:hypothetical protein
MVDHFSDQSFSKQGQEIVQVEIVWMQRAYK